MSAATAPISASPKVFLIQVRIRFTNRSIRSEETLGARRRKRASPIQYQSFALRSF